MLKWSNITLTLIALLLLSGLLSAQTAQPKSASTDKVQRRLVTASVAGESIRFSSLGELIQMRLEVIGPSGERLFDSDFKAGNLIDWPGSDKEGHPLADGTYLCVVTVTDAQGEITRKHTVAKLQGHALSLSQSNTSLLPAVQTQAAGSIADEDEGLIIVDLRESLAAAIIAHDGNAAHLVSGRGGLSISSGDFFANKLLEHIRLTAEGNVGIGMPNPQARLDVAGRIRASEGIVFPDGSVQFSASKKTFGAASLRPGQSQQIQGQDAVLAPDTTGTGTNNKIPKWQDGPNGVLTDSNMFDVNGSIGINGTPDTRFRLDVNGSTRIRGSNPGFNLEGLRAAGNIWVFQTVDDDGRFRLFSQDNINPGVERLTIGLNTGNVGIGTSTPSRQLELSATQAISRLTSINNLNGSVLELRNTTASPTLLGAINFMNAGTTAGQIAYRGLNNSLTLTTNSSERLRIDSLGNVGIGSTQPKTILDVVHPSTQIRFGSTLIDEGGYLISTEPTQAIMSGGAKFSGSAWVPKSTGASIIENVDGIIRFFTNLTLPPLAFSPTERMRITSAGDVGIGTATPAARLDVNGDVNVNGAIIIAPQTRHLSIPGAGFTLTEASRYELSGAGIAIANDGNLLNRSMSAAAMVNLPDGAVVTRMRANVSDDDNEAGQNIRVQLEKKGFTNGLDAPSVMADVSSAGSGDNFTISTTNISSATIDNQGFSYYILVTSPAGPGGTWRVWTVIIDYTVTSPLP